MRHEQNSHFDFSFFFFLKLFEGLSWLTFLTEVVVAHDSFNMVQMCENQ